jgi:hypothetical protein
MFAVCGRALRYIEHMFAVCGSAFGYIKHMFTVCGRALRYSIIGKQYVEGHFKKCPTTYGNIYSNKCK